VAFCVVVQIVLFHNSHTGTMQDNAVTLFVKT